MLEANTFRMWLLIGAVAVFGIIVIMVAGWVPDLYTLFDGFFDRRVQAY